MSARRWGVVRVEVPAGHADEIAGELGYGTLGVALEAAGPNRVRVSVYVESTEQAACEGERCRRLLERRFGGAVPTGTVSVDVQPDEAWVERYQATLGPLAIGEGFVVVPHGFEDRTGRRAIRMVPGRAFGTGEHPTTRLCVRALESAVRAGSRWLDVGTGSGILALVAARCGAGRVVGIDVDPEAVAVARRWVRVNEATESVEISDEPADRFRGAGFDGAVANISCAFWLERGAELIGTVRLGGALIASGFDVTDADLVASLLAEAGFVEVQRDFEDGWGVLVMEAAVRGST